MNHSIFRKLMAILLALVMCLGLLPMGALAEGEDGETPEQPTAATPVVKKTVVPNKDSAGNNNGTYTISLSIKGDADPVEEGKSGNVNVVIVYDTSVSMLDPISGPGQNRPSRADQAENVVHDFLANLEGYQNDAKDNINVALVTFYTSATTYGAGQGRTGWTTNVASITALFDDDTPAASNPDGPDVSDGRYLQTYSGHYGTNWEAALTNAVNLVGNVGNEYPTFVVMITDGAPTDSNQDDALNPETATLPQLRTRYNRATDEARELYNATAPDGKFFGIYAFGDEADLLDDLIYFSEHGTHRGDPTGTNNMQYVVGGTNFDGTTNYFRANDTVDLNLAIDSIFEAIIAMIGIADAEMDDGISVKDPETSHKLIDLVDVVPGTFKYYRSGGAYGNGSPGQLWDPIPQSCEAKVVDGEVVWNLKGATDTGVLENGVTYTVTFECATSQDALDMIAELENGTIELVKKAGDPNDPTIPDVPDEIAPYVFKGTDGHYTMLTNSYLNVKYKDTRVGDNPIEYDPKPKIDPVPVEAEPISIEKTWVGGYQGESDAKKIGIGIKMDGEDSDLFNLYYVSDDTTAKHTGSRYISTGVMTKKDDGTVNTVVHGHDFELTEKVEGSSVGYHWELDAETMHPMLINGVVKMLVKVEDTTKVPSGVTATKSVTMDGVTYYKIGDTFYKESGGSAALSATNYRRSNLYFTKVVDGSGAPGDAVFPVTFNVVNSQAPETAPTQQEDPKHDSDWWVWYSVRDKDGNRINEGVTGATSAGDGYWYAASEDTVTIPVKAGYSIRIGNLPTGTTYTITEGDLGADFSFVKSELGFTSTVFSDVDVEEADDTFSGDKTTTGTIQYTNSDYTVTYTNKYELGALQVTKAFEGITSSQIPNPFTITVSYTDAAGQSATKDLKISEGQNVQAPDTGSAFPNYSWTIYDIKPDTQVSVSESGTNVKNYTLSADSVLSGSAAIKAGNKETVPLKNIYTRDTVDLKITKTFEGIGEDLISQISKFKIEVVGQGDTYTLTLSDNDVSQSQDGLTYTWTKNVKTGDYTVKETGAGLTDYNYTATYALGNDTAQNLPDTGAVVKVVKGAEAKLAVVNTYTQKTGDLKITKTVLPTDFTGAPAIVKVTVKKGNQYVSVADDGTGSLVDQEAKIEVPVSVGKTITGLPIGEYTVEEVADSAAVDGYNVATTYNPTTQKATVAEKTDENASTYTAATVAITNTYTQKTGTLDTSTTAILNKTVTADSTKWAPKTFEFTIAGVEGAPLGKDADGKEVTTGTAKFDAAGTQIVDFGTITYTQVGDYTYTITETAPGTGWKVTTSPATVTVKVEDKGGDTLTVTPTAVTITNSYTTPKPPSHPDHPTPPALNSEDHFYYVEGYPDGTVQPQGNITRAETATMIYRLLTAERRDEIFTDQNSFSDMDATLWYNKAVSSMASGQYISGYPDGTFKGDNKITRAEFVTIVARFLENTETGDNPFTDINDHWALDYILAAVEAGWVDGYPDVTFKPDQYITRAEAMKIVNSVLNRGIDENSKLGQPEHMFPDNSDTSAWYYYEVVEATNDHEYTGQRPNETWTRNAVDYVYDIVKYERP